MNTKYDEYWKAFRDALNEECDGPKMKGPCVIRIRVAAEYPDKNNFKQLIKFLQSKLEEVGWKIENFQMIPISTWHGLADFSFHTTP